MYVLQSCDFNGLSLNIFSDRMYRANKYQYIDMLKTSNIKTGRKRDERKERQKKKNFNTFHNNYSKFIFSFNARDISR